MLVCDCGGGTVDITTYVVFTTKPLQFEELCEGIGMAVDIHHISANDSRWEMRFHIHR